LQSAQEMIAARQAKGEHKAKGESENSRKTKARRSKTEDAQVPD